MRKNRGVAPRWMVPTPTAPTTPVDNTAIVAEQWPLSIEGCPHNGGVCTSGKGIQCCLCGVELAGVGVRWDGSAAGGVHA